MARHYEVTGDTEFGYTIRHRGTGLIVPHLGHIRCPEGVSSNRSVIRYRSDAKRYAEFLDDFPGMGTSQCPSLDTLRELADWLRAHPWVPVELRGHGHEYLKGMR